MSRPPSDFSDEVWERFFDAAEQCDLEMPQALVDEELDELGIDTARGEQRVRRLLQRAQLGARLAVMRESFAAGIGRIRSGIEDARPAVAHSPILAGELQVQFRNLEGELSDEDWQSVWADAGLLRKMAEETEGRPEWLSELMPENEPAPDDKPNVAGAVAAARELWAICGHESIDDFILDDLAMSLGVAVIDGGWNASDARLLRGWNVGVIRTNSNIDDPQRRRFSIAHELGHWVMDHGSVRPERRTLVSENGRPGRRPLLQAKSDTSYSDDSPLIACNPGEIDYDKVGPREVEANRFAAELLMPQDLFVRDMQQINRDKGGLSFATIDALVELYDTSPAATGRRVAEFSAEPAAFVVSENGKIQWWRASESFRGCGWIRKTVQPDTPAGKYFAGEPMDHAPKTVRAKSWLHRADSGFELIEESRVLDKYGHVLTLLHVRQ